MLGKKLENVINYSIYINNFKSYYITNYSTKQLTTTFDQQFPQKFKMTTKPPHPHITASGINTHGNGEGEIVV